MTTPIPAVRHAVLTLYLCNTMAGSSICESVSTNESCVCNSSVLNECLWEPEVPYSIALAVILAFSYIVIFFLAFCWNTFVISVFMKDRYLLQEPSSLFLFLFAVVDVLQTILAIPFYLAAIIGGGWIFGSTDTIREGVCIAVAFLFCMFLFMTVHLLAVIAFDRYLFIVHPLKYRQWMSLPKAVCLVSLVSIVPLILASLPFFGFGRLGYSPVVGVCVFRWEGERPYVITVAAEAMLPIIATVVFTLWTYIHVKRFLNRRHIRQMSIDMTTVKNQRVQRTLTRTFVLLLISQAVCFTPGIITAFVGFFVEYRNIPSTVFVIDFLIIVSSVAINPIIQTLSRSNFRNYLTLLFHKLRCKQRELTPAIEQCIESRTSNGEGCITELSSTSIVNTNQVPFQADNITASTQFIECYDIDPIHGTLV